MIYPIFRTYFRFALPAFYREIEVVGKARVPSQGPLLLVGNHNNAFLDPIMVAAELDRPIQLTAKSTLARMPIVGRLMRAAGVILLHREQDRAEGADPRRNLEALDAIVERLGQGAAVCIFPEGRSHGEPGLARFKRGAARIAFDYLEAGAVAGDLWIQPFGYWFEAKAKRRSRACLAFGEPVSASAWRAAHPEDRGLELTRELEAQVAALTLSFDSQADRLRLSALAELLEAASRTPVPIGVNAAPPSRHVQLIRRLIEGRAALQARDAVRLEAMEHRCDALRAQLDALGVGAEDLYLTRGGAASLGFVAREGLLALAGLPAAAWGALIWATPFWLTRQLVRRFGRSEEELASWAVFGAFLIYPVWALVACGLAWWWLRPGLALAVSLSLLPAGGFAQAWLDHVGAAARRARAYLRLGRQPRRREAMADEGRAILAALLELATEIDATTRPR